MRNHYTCSTSFSAPAIFTFLLMLFFCLFVQLANAQNLYKAVSASQLDITERSNVNLNLGIKSEGAYLIKDGQLDEIYNLKLILPTAKLDSTVKDKKITFEQTRVMVLPIMGMVHIIGILDVDGVKSTTNFQLGFKVNSDQTITFKGTKSFILSDLVNGSPNDELRLAIDFVLKNSTDNLAVLKVK